MRCRVSRVVSTAAILGVFTVACVRATEKDGPVCEPGFLSMGVPTANEVYGMFVLIVCRHATYAGHLYAV